MSELQKNMTEDSQERGKVQESSLYFVICVNEFAKRYNIGAKDALLYLDKYEGMKFLEEFYVCSLPFTISNPMVQK